MFKNSDSVEKSPDLFLGPVWIYRIHPSPLSFQLFTESERNGVKKKKIFLSGLKAVGKYCCLENGGLLKKVIGIDRTNSVVAKWKFEFTNIHV